MSRRTLNYLALLLVRPGGLLSLGSVGGSKYRSIHNAGLSFRIPIIARPVYEDSWPAPAFLAACSQVRPVWRRRKYVRYIFQWFYYAGPRLRLLWNNLSGRFISFIAISFGRNFCNFGRGCFYFSKLTGRFFSFYRFIYLLTIICSKSK